MKLFCASTPIRRARAGNEKARLILAVSPSSFTGGTLRPIQVTRNIITPRWKMAMTLPACGDISSNQLSSAVAIPRASPVRTTRSAQTSCEPELKILRFRANARMTPTK